MECDLPPTAPKESIPKLAKVARGDLRFYRNCLQNIQKSIRLRDDNEVENAADNNQQAAFTGSQQSANNMARQSDLNIAEFPETANLLPIAFKNSPHRTRSVAESLASPSIAASNISDTTTKRVTFQTTPVTNTSHSDTALSVKDAQSVSTNPVFVSPRPVGTSGNNFSFVVHIENCNDHLIRWTCYSRICECGIRICKFSWSCH